MPGGIPTSWWEENERASAELFKAADSVADQEGAETEAPQDVTLLAVVSEAVSTALGDFAVGFSPDKDLLLAVKSYFEEKRYEAAGEKSCVEGARFGARNQLVFSTQGKISAYLEVLGGTDEQMRSKAHEAIFERFFQVLDAHQPPKNPGTESVVA